MYKVGLFSPLLLWVEECIHFGEGFLWNLACSVSELFHVET